MADSQHFILGDEVEKPEAPLSQYLECKHMMEMTTLGTKINWPYGKRFAFTVFDDTDFTTMQNGPGVYQFLYDLGLITTKSVWPIKGEQVPKFGGTTCADAAYVAWVRKLKQQGFEIALHNATYHTSNRAQVIAGLEQFKNLFGEYPTIHANHSGCDDCIYWGDARLSGTNKLVYNLLTRFRNREKYLGSVESSDLFWGDKCREHMRYVRNFVYSDINTLKACPYMPYFDKERPFVNNWFASSEGPTCQSFCRTISEKNQDRLEEEGGGCIMYTHFGTDGFFHNGRLNSDFARLMERLSRKSGWFVPVSTLLDHIQHERGSHVISARERNQLERKWIREKVFITRGRT